MGRASSHAWKAECHRPCDNPQLVAHGGSKSLRGTSECPLTRIVIWLGQAQRTHPSPKCKLPQGKPPALTEGRSTQKSVAEYL